MDGERDEFKRLDVRLSTGVLVLYADEESFTLMTPQGHTFAGWITFSAWDEGGCTVCQVQSMARANDPNGMMRGVAARMTEREIRAVAEYAAGLAYIKDIDVQRTVITQAKRTPERAWLTEVSSGAVNPLAMGAELEATLPLHFLEHRGGPAFPSRPHCGRNGRHGNLPVHASARSRLMQQRRAKEH